MSMRWHSGTPTPGNLSPVPRPPVLGGGADHHPGLPKDPCPWSVGAVRPTAMSIEAKAGPLTVKTAPVPVPPAGPAGALAHRSGVNPAPALGAQVRAGWRS